MLDIWNVHKGSEGLLGGSRPADELECLAYLTGLAERAGLPWKAYPSTMITVGVIDGNKRRPRIAGITFGTSRAPNKAGGPKIWDAGSFSVAMPGAFQTQTVIVEQLDEAGEVERSSIIGLKKGEVKLNATVIRKMCALPTVAKKRGRPAKAISAPAPESGTIPAETLKSLPAASATSTAPEFLPVVDSALQARVEVLERLVSKLGLAAPGDMPSAANDATAPAPSEERRSPARLRMIAVYLRMRAERAKLRRQLASAQAESYVYQGKLNTAEKEWKDAAGRAFDLERERDAMREERDAADRRLWAMTNAQQGQERRNARLARVAADQRQKTRKAEEQARNARAECSVYAAKWREVSNVMRSLEGARRHPVPMASSAIAFARLSA